MAEIEITYEYIQQAAQHSDVRKRTEDLAETIASRARGLASGEGVEMTVTVESGTRPGGRPYSNVVGDNPDQEFGSSRTDRRRILGRAAEGAK